MGLYLIIISVRINGSLNMNLILEVVRQKILMILICKPLIFKNILLTINLSLHLEILYLSDSVAFPLDYFELWLIERFVHNNNRILILSMKKTML